MNVRLMWVKMTNGKTFCNWYRDRDGFCWLTNRCWEKKPCPKSQRAADKAMLSLKEEAIARRDKVTA